MPKRSRATGWNYSQCVDLARIALRHLERSEKEERVQKVIFSKWSTGQLVNWCSAAQEGGTEDLYRVLVLGGVLPACHHFLGSAHSTEYEVPTPYSPTFCPTIVVADCPERRFQVAQKTLQCPAKKCTPGMARTGALPPPKKSPLAPVGLQSSIGPPVGHTIHRKPPTQKKKKTKRLSQATIKRALTA